MKARYLSCFSILALILGLALVSCENNTTIIQVVDEPASPEIAWLDTLTEAKGTVEFAFSMQCNQPIETIQLFLDGYPVVAPLYFNGSPAALPRCITAKRWCSLGTAEALLTGRILLKSAPIAAGMEDSVSARAG